MTNARHRRLLVSIAAAAALAAGCGPGAGAAPPQQQKSGSRAYRVSVEKVAGRPLTYSVSAIGALEAYQVVTVPARVEGALDRFDFEEGSVVTPDTVLAVIDERRYALVVAQTRANVEEAKAAATQAEAAAGSAAARTARSRAALDEAESTFQRWKAMREKNEGLVTSERLQGLEMLSKTTRASFDEAVAGEREAAALVSQMLAAVTSKDAAVAIAQKNVEDTRVRSPIGGIVEKRHVAQGQYVKVGEPVATLVDASRLRLRFSVGESESVRLKPGQTVTFRVRAFADRAFEAELIHVDATADPVSRMVSCLATVAKPDPALRPGFFAQVAVEMSRSDDAIVVPEGALLATEKGFVSYVVEGGKAAQRPLVLGLHTKDGGVEVLQGLAAGDVLVVRGAQSLQPGVPVEVVPGEKP